MASKVRIIDYAPKVFLVGETKAEPKGFAEYLAYRDLEWNSPSVGQKLALPIIEFAGRVCYESFHNPKDDAPYEYVDRTTIGKEHWSISEHVSFNFAIASLPRTTLLELERHRVGTAFSFRSTRYVDTWLEFCIPPLYRDNGMLIDEFTDLVHASVDEYHRILTLYKDKQKKVRTEAARAVLPSSLTADGLFTCNINALRHILKLRLAEGADASMREFAESMLQCVLDNVETDIGYLVYKAVKED